MKIIISGHLNNNPSYLERLETALDQALAHSRQLDLINTGNSLLGGPLIDRPKKAFYDLTQNPLMAAGTDIPVAAFAQAAASCAALKDLLHPYDDGRYPLFSLDEVRNITSYLSAFPDYGHFRRGLPLAYHQATWEETKQGIERFRTFYQKIRKKGGQSLYIIGNKGSTDAGMIRNFLHHDDENIDYHLRKAFNKYCALPTLVKRGAERADGYGMVVLPFFAVKDKELTDIAAKVVTYQQKSSAGIAPKPLIIIIGGAPCGFEQAYQKSADNTQHAAGFEWFLLQLARHNIRQPELVISSRADQFAPRYGQLQFNYHAGDWSIPTIHLNPGEIVEFNSQDLLRPDHDHFIFHN